MTDPDILSLFHTLVRRAPVGGASDLMADLEAICWSLAQDDTAGQAWCESHGYHGYTSYSSLDDLPTRFSVFADLVGLLDAHVAAFVEIAGFDLQGRLLELDNIWVNILPQGGVHTSHIHPNNVVSGTLYVAVPDGSSALKLEDPRHAMMMAAPQRLAGAPQPLQPFVHLTPAVGDVILWESWLRHEVVMNQAEDERLSVSFNYRWR